MAPIPLATSCAVATPLLSPDNRHAAKVAELAVFNALVTQVVRAVLTSTPH